MLTPKITRRLERWFAISHKIRIALGIAALIAGIWLLIAVVVVIASGVPVVAFVN